MKFNLKDCFICDYCRNICKGSCNDIKEKIISGKYKVGSKEYNDNLDLTTDRKQIIHCLGKFCDKPCKYNKEDAYKEIPYEVLFNLGSFLIGHLSENAYKEIPYEVLFNSIKFLGQKLNDELLYKNKESDK